MEAWTSAVVKPKRGTLRYVRLACPWWFAQDRFERIDSHRLRFYGWESEITMLRSMVGDA